MTELNKDILQTLASRQLVDLISHRFTMLTSILIYDTRANDAVFNRHATLNETTLSHTDNTPIQQTDLVPIDFMREFQNSDLYVLRQIIRDSKSEQVRASSSNTTRRQPVLWIMVVD